MSESTEVFPVTLPTGQSTKPYAREKIRAALESGKLPANAFVVTPDGDASIIDFCATQNPSAPLTLAKKYGLPMKFAFGGFLGGIGLWSFALREDAGSWMGIASIAGVVWLIFLFTMVSSHALMSRLFPATTKKLNNWVKWQTMTKEQQEKAAATMAIAAGKATYDDIRETARQVSQ